MSFTTDKKIDSTLAFTHPVGEFVNLNTNKKRYPYTKNRVFLSGIIAALSTIFAISLLLFDLLSLLYYLFVTFVVVIITFFSKKRLYNFIITENQEEKEKDTNRPSWKIMLITFFMLIGSIGLPLLSALFLSGPVWFIMITSFMTGVSISEIVIYVQTRSR